MYAIISLKGHQFRVEPGTVLEIDRLAGEAGDTVTIENSVLLANDDNGLTTGTPVIEGANVELEIVEQFRGKKVIAFKMKRRKRYRRKQGHRQELTRVKIKGIKLA